MVSSLRYVFAAACIVAGAVVACGPGFLDGISGGARGDAGTSSSSSGAVDSATCGHAEPPAAPAGMDTTDTVTLPVFAVDMVRVDTLAANADSGVAPLGFDLDHTCTCESQGNSCKPSASAPDGGTCDGPDGRDNGFGSLFNALVEGIPAFPSTFATERIQQGHFTVLVDLLGWNGQPDDPAVQIAIRQSQKIDGTPPDDGGRIIPNFDGNDVWTVDPTTITGGASAIGKDCQDPANAFQCIALLRDSKAYVTNNTIVAQPRVTGAEDGPVTITLRTSVGVIALDFHDFTMTAQIIGPVNGAYMLSGQLSGSFTANSLLNVFGNLQDFTSSDPTQVVCNDPTTFAFMKSGVCSQRDLSLSGDPNAACDSVSAAISFGASPAKAGTVYAGPNPTSQCSDAGFTCDN